MSTKPKKLVPGVDISQECYNLAVQAFKKRKEAEKRLSEKGLKLCPMCQAIVVPEKWECCAICANKQKGKTYGQGGQGGIAKG
jgi:hypothetical protein